MTDDTSSDAPAYWTRYEERVQNHEWSDSKSPDEFLDEGKVLVAHGYRARTDHKRKLHAYHRGEDGSFHSLCGLAREHEHPDALSPLDPSTFVRRADACLRCVSISDYDAPRPQGSAAGVRYDPFGVFDYGKRDSDLPELPDPPDEYVCPDCGDSYSSAGIGQHWGHPRSDCEYPVPSEYERNILTGLWLAGGSIEKNGTYPILRKTSVRKYPLDWLAHELGVWGVDVSESNDRFEQQKNVEDGFGYAEAGSHQQYRLTTRTCPFLDDLDDAGLDDIELTPLAARILFSFRGHVIDQSAVSVRHPDGHGLVELLHDTGFTETSLYEPDEGKNQWKVTLSAEDSREFAEWIGGVPLPGTPDSKQFDFRDRGPQGQRPSKRVTPDINSAKSDTQTLSQSSAPETISLEPDWGWLGACLTKLGEDDLARRAYDGDLSKTEVYGEVLTLIHANQNDLPTLADVPS